MNSTAEITAAQVKLSEYVIKRYSKPANQAEQIEVKSPKSFCFCSYKVITWKLSFRYCKNYLLTSEFLCEFWSAV